MNKLQKTLIRYCDALISRLQNDKASDFFGGFYCSACGIYHGRADNAVYPMLYAYSLTGDEKYTDCAKNLLIFRKKLTDSDGGVFNDFGSGWKGITVFSALAFYKTLKNLSDVLPADLKEALERLFEESAKWVYDDLFIGAKAYINYYAAAAAVNAAAGEYFRLPEYTLRARELLKYCLSLFTENGLLCGEGQPHDSVSKKGCRPIDIGYNAEEAFPALADAAMILGDRRTEKVLARHAEKMLDFMLPDGAWDNSFGTRSNKWTYWGSRTSDGCAGAFCALSEFLPELKTAAAKNAALMIKCSENGLLCGGRDYEKLGQPVCIHHTLTHAVSLTDAALYGLTGEEALPPEPDTCGFSYKYYPELDTYKIKAGQWLAAVTGYDFANGNYARGASHASGGAMSLLYHKDLGAVLAGSTYEYRLTEPNNMQPPAGDIPHETLMMRAEYEKNGVKYASCLDFEANIKVSAQNDSIRADVTAHFADVKEHKPENENLLARFSYVFTRDEVKISCEIIGQNGEKIRFIVPVIDNSAKLVSEYACTKRKIFFLTGGFAANEYTFELTAGKTELTLYPETGYNI